MPLSCRKEEFVWVMTLNKEGLIIIRADVDNNKLLNLKLKLTQIAVLSEVSKQILQLKASGK